MASSFHSMPDECRPRERLLKRGAAALTNAELLMIFLRTGTKSHSLHEIANGLLDANKGSITELARQSPEALCRVPGLGPAKTAQLLAAFELARRSLQESLEEAPCLSSPDIVKQFLGWWLTQRPYESFCILFLNSQNKLISAEEISRGSLCESTVYPREVIRHALNHNAASLILAHNHPSGHTVPSKSDIHLTLALRDVLRLISVEVLDHFIVGSHVITSMRESGCID